MLRDMIPSLRARRGVVDGSVSVLLHGNRSFAEAGRRLCGPDARPPERGFSPWQAVGPLRSRGRVAANPHDRIGCLPQDYAAIPETLLIREFRRRIARKGYRTRTIIVATTLLDAEQYPAGRDREAVSTSLGSGNQSAFPQDHDEHGRAPLPNSRHGAQGDLGAPVGVQPGPDSHRPGGGQAWKTSTTDQLCTSDEDLGGVPPRDCPRFARAARRALRTHACGNCFS